MAEQRVFPERKLNQEDMMNNWLFGAPVEQGGKRPNLRVRMSGNSPRFVVNTNVKNDTNNGRIEFNCDYTTFSAVLSAIESIALKKTSERVRFEYKNNWVAGKKLASFMVLSTLEVGRWKDGRMYICVRSTQSGRPSIPFFFEPSVNHGVAYVGDREITPEEVSEIYALAFVRVHADIMGQLLVINFDPEGKGVARPPQMQGGGQQRGNYGGNNNGGGNNYQKRSAPTPPPSDSFDEFDEFS